MRLNAFVDTKHSDPLISNDRKKTIERAALRYGRDKAGHQRG